MPVMVIGASGNVGRLVVRALLEQGAEVTALVRDADGELPPGSPLAESGVKLVKGDLREPETVRAGAEGCSAMFVLTPHSPEQVELQNAAVDVASDVGARIVKVSSWGPSVHEDSPVPGARRHWITQQYIRKRGLPYTILCPNYFMQVLINRYAGEVRRRGVLVSPAGTRGISMIDLKDVAEVAARVLTEEGHDGMCYTLSGPTAPTYPELAHELGELTGRQISYHDLSETEFNDWMVREGRQQWETDHAAGIFELYREGIGELVTDTVREITGREPYSIHEFLKANLHHFMPDGGTA